jgi:DNA-binding transcriptional regulator YdaS (Cro superfamily)
MALMGKHAIKKAVKVAGGQTALARKLGVTQGLVWQWLNHADSDPLNFAPAIEQETGVKCEELCPQVAWQRDPSGRITGYTITI